MKNPEFEDSFKGQKEDEDKDRMFIDYDDPSRYSVVRLPSCYDVILERSVMYC